MVEELKGKNGKIVGSEEYFKKIGEKEIAGDFFQKKLNSNCLTVVLYIAKYAIEAYTKNKIKISPSASNELKKLEKSTSATSKQKTNTAYQKKAAEILTKEMKLSLNRIADTIKKDIDSHLGRDKYIIYENRVRIRNAIQSLKSCGVDNLSSLEKKLLQYRRLEDFNNKIISLSFAGEQYPVEVNLKWENGKNILYIHVKVKFSFPDGFWEQKHIKDYYNRKKTQSLKGFEMWSGTYERVFKNHEGAQCVTVKCEAEEITEGEAINVNIYASHNRSKTNWGTGWETSQPGNIDLYGSYLSSDANKESSKHMKNVAKHELGHILGLANAYSEVTDKPLNYAAYPDIKEDIKNHVISEYITKYKDEPGFTTYTGMVMNNSEANISNNDIEMLILAWQKGEVQFYYTDERREGTISEAMGK